MKVTEALWWLTENFKELEEDPLQFDEDINRKHLSLKSKLGSIVNYKIHHQACMFILSLEQNLWKLIE